MFENFTLLNLLTYLHLIIMGMYKNITESYDISKTSKTF